MDDHSHARGVEFLGRLYGDGYRGSTDTDTITIAGSRSARAGPYTVAACQHA